jgi:hypothetical protein
MTGTVTFADGGLGQAVPMRHRSYPVHPPRSAFAGFRFPPEVITVAVHWYLRYGLSYRDVEELLAERRIAVDHVIVYRWVQRFTHCFSTPRGRVGTPPVTGDSPMKHTSKSQAGGLTYTGPSTSSARSSMFSPRRNGIWQPPVASSPKRLSRLRDRVR